METYYRYMISNEYMDIFEVPDPYKTKIIREDLAMYRKQLKEGTITFEEVPQPYQDMLREKE